MVWCVNHSIKEHYNESWSIAVELLFFISLVNLKIVFFFLCGFCLHSEIEYQSINDDFIGRNSVLIILLNNLFYFSQRKLKCIQYLCLFIVFVLNWYIAKIKYFDLKLPWHLNSISGTSKEPHLHALNGKWIIYVY